MKLRLRFYGDPVLRTKAAPVAAFDDDLRRLAKDMLDLMRAEKGVGLAAQQVGETRAICVVDVPPEADVDDRGERENPGLAMPIVLVNPEIADASKRTESCEEGCLSFPDIRAAVTRPREIRVRFRDENGAARDIRADGLVARAIQHEMDHLNGVLLADRMSAVKKVALAGRLRRLREETREALRRA